MITLISVLKHSPLFFRGKYCSFYSTTFDALYKIKPVVPDIFNSATGWDLFVTGLRYLRAEMGLVQCFVIVLMLSAQWVLSSPVTDGIRFYTMYGRRCQMCPAGEYEKSCNECERCPAGTYTTDWNRENDCHRCYGDCRPDLHLKVSQNCTSKSDVKCICEAGYRCTATVPYTTNCRDCAKIQETTTTEVAAVTSDKGKHTASSTSSGQSSSSSKPCTFPECGPRSVPKSTTGPHLETDKTRSQLAAILCPVVAMGCMALVILFFVRRPGDESCFKQAIAKLRNKVQSMSIILGQSSSACSVSLQARLVLQLKVGRWPKEGTAKRKTRETVLCFIPHPLPVFISLRRRGAERLTAFSFPPRSRGRTAMCPKRRHYDASCK
ncbi:tumor necrosis factor receptor superfamily member 5 isoform X2 [Micropterus salmoides]|uniref:tumor necrosis factor receptor superfamily member 5 isoform X2 n=1 Tax=Micropterus salmoides TaxID=27706 RepID=UPI0018ED763D|nr:tumor necrosis factor receptor superfamily member 5 isoform X2 [Micropterus salmoides]